MRSASPFHPLASAIDLPEAERRRIEWWREHRIFERSLEQTADGPLWVFYEGPPTANGTPGTHHVEARVFKDVFPRFRTMKGFRVPRRAGWDCHGLPVELAVERELGLSGKPDVERLGIAEFNARCRESVQRYVGEFEAVTTRMGYWIDLSTAYWTMSAPYVDSVWWALRRIFDAGLLVEDYRAAPYCPRDQTTLSAHEVAQGYETVEDPSVFVRLPLEEPLAGHDAQLLVWTTTPWTLVSNTAVAVHPEVTYVLARGERGTFVVAESLTDVFGGEVVARIPGRDLAGLAYRPPFDLVEVPDAHRVVLADYVSTTDGTGLVHLAPAFGPDDLATGRANGLAVVDPLGPDGRFDPALPLIGGMFFKDADQVLVEDLRRRDALVGEGTIEHAYPHCWRCHTPLMYLAQPSWYIRTTAIHQALQRENENTRWYPEHVKHGRFGDWLAGNVDWALSRNRYWGTPLPLWRCADGHVTAIGSRAELGERTGRDLSELDPHRPHIDEITFACPECGQRAARVPEVIDAWFDSGSMPFAQLGYPHAPGSAEALARNYPADYICEALDQTRGWFYTLMAIGTLLFDRSSYRNVVCLGHILAEDGRKMSKHLGNVLEPLPLMEAHGADALRWFMLCSGSPWSPRRVGHEALREIVRKVLLTYWNTASFFNRYAALSEWAEPDPPDERPVLDRWVLARLNQVVRQVDSRLEDYDTAGAGRVLAEFVDDLSNWYVRRSRPRFWDGEVNALRTLHECLDVLTRLLAPFIPFLTEEVWQRTVRPGSPDLPDSVHLSAWPAPGPIDEELLSLVDVERRLAVAGRSLRRDEALKVRQPLATAVISPELPAELRADLAEEINVREVVTGDVAGTGWPSEEQREVGIALDTAITPELRLAGLAREIIRFVQNCRKQDGREITDRISLRWSGSAEVGEALRAHRDEIAAAVLAAEVVESADAGEHADAKLGMSVTLVRA
ncbi:isoleucine--tRNA ligase [Saccharopolyspora sp. NPDC049426]|uniref:isoleucine--tRNA ligase n=1 Tax=Saccharopolyspora sp. NPDC049426 TaxID=3155652 RepID=UPI00341408A8